MKCGRFILAVALLLAASVPLVFAQDAVIVLNNKELGAHERPLVSFTHEKHMAGIECLQCHHDYDKFHNNKGGDGRPCSDCHKANGTKENPLPLREAFHQNCKGCHEMMLSQGKQSGPVTCGECHVKK